MDVLSNRLHAELKRLIEVPEPGIISIVQDDYNERHFHVRLVGPPGSPYGYQHELFKISIIVSELYPEEAPCVRFKTPIFHEHVDYNTGLLSLDRCPTWYLRDILRFILDLFKTL